MRLTHIKLAGFKSFVDPTTIAVPGQLVAVIGPNGCGKSNVIDAIRWVLGEASAKQLRGESMQDVIFNGASSRSPAIRASVELVFDNSDGQLAGLWGQYGTIAIKRQLTRQGDSSYYINNQLVRRRDITDLFLGTGVSARGYAVIEQGMISRIIEARPEELRTYIEEAAGISKYKERRRETENRLTHAREHLQRLADLQTELDRQVEKLQKQAKTATQYQQLQTELIQQQDLLNYSRWQLALKNADQATIEYQTHHTALDTLQEHIQQQHEQLHTLRLQEQTRQQQWREAERQQAALREHWVRLEEQLRHQRDWQQRIQQEQEQTQNRLLQLSQADQQQLERLAQAQHELEEQTYVREEWALQVSEYKNQLPQLEIAGHDLQATQQSQQSELARLERELAMEQQQQQHTTHNLERLYQRQHRLQQEQAELALPSEADVSAAQQQVNQLQQQITQLEAQQTEAEQHQQRAQQHWQNLQQQQQQLIQQKLTLSAQIDAITTLLPQQEDNDFWQQVTTEHLPVLWQHLTVEPQWQHAISVILGQRLQARCISQLQLPSPLPTGAAVWVNQPPLAHQIAQPAAALLQHVQASETFAPIIQFWLTNVLCADDLSQALQRQATLTANQIIVTPEGHWLDGISVHLFTADTNEHLLQRQQQVRGLNEQLATLILPLEQTEAALTQAQEQLQTLENQQRQRFTHLKQQQQHLHSLSSDTQQLLTRINQGQLRQKNIEQELQSIQTEIKQLSQRHPAIDTETLSIAITQLQQQLSLNQQQQQQQQQQLKQLQLHLLEAQQQQGLADMAYIRLQQTIETAQHERARIADEIMQQQQQQQELALTLLQQPLDDEQQTQTELIHTQLTAANESCQQAQAALQNTQALLQQAQQQYQTLTSQLPDAQNRSQQALLQQQEALLQARTHHDTLAQKQTDLTALANHWYPEIDLSALSIQITLLTKKINALGAVNLAALSELAETQERSQYYQTQGNDVQAAIDLLAQAITQIDDETKLRFKTTFDAVKQKVQEYFPVLFGGGQAQLNMVGDNLLDAGVSIMAHPPGKKNSTIHLLSGGEKALTAMSLVFALFSLNPAPFCLLDEVDAPLDDANTSRFCQLVQQMSTQTQFLYISHNRLTMEMAEQLVGVTMQEKGVSRIVAVNIRQALDMANSD